MGELTSMAEALMIAGARNDTIAASSPMPFRTHYWLQNKFISLMLPRLAAFHADD